MAQYVPAGGARQRDERGVDMRLVLRCVVAFLATFVLWFGPKVLGSSFRDSVDMIWIDLTGALCFGVVYTLLLPVQFRRSNHFTRTSVVWQPILVALLGWVLVLLPRLWFIPILTPLSHFVGRAWPMGHFGFIAFYICVAYSAALAILLIKLGGALQRRMRGGAAQQR
jgi:hypothetical protein